MNALRMLLGIVLAYALCASAASFTQAAVAANGTANIPLFAGLQNADASHTSTEPPNTAAQDDAPGMPKWILHGIKEYGAITIFFAFVVSGIGLHLSEDLILIPAGWLAANDWKLFAKFAVAAYAGIVLGDSGWFWMCRTFGTRVMHTKNFKRLFHPRRLLEIKWQIDQRGAWVLLAARFIPGTRTPVITMCGLLHMAWWKLLLVECSCVLISAPMQMMIGWLAFHAAAQAGVTNTFHQVMVGVSVTLAVVIGLWLLHKWLESRKSKHRPPRASVRWLRHFQASATTMKSFESATKHV